MPTISSRPRCVAVPRTLAGFSFRKKTLTRVPHQALFKKYEVSPVPKHREWHGSHGGLMQIKDELGRGAFSIVKLAVDRSTGKGFAVKIIEKKNVAQEYKKNLQTETEILRKVAFVSGAVCVD